MQKTEWWQFQVGDGTTSVVLLAGELLKEVKGYIEDGVSPHVIIKGYREAARLVCIYFAFLTISAIASSHVQLAGNWKSKAVSGQDRQE